MGKTMRAMLIASLAPLAAVVSAQQDQPHLAQAWQAMSTGDGLPGQTGLESYLYEDYKTEGALRGHIWDYGESCKKIEVSSNNEKELRSGTYYIKCDTVDCCFSTVGGHGGT